MAVLPDLSQLSREELIAQLLAARKAAETRLTLKVTDKGGVSLYGLGRFPVTLYASQWRRLLSHAPAISAFLTANAGSLAEKG